VLIVLAEWITNVELQWQEPRHARFLRRLASLSRVVTIDRRGTGLSDRVAGTGPTLEASMDDVVSVMDHLEVDRATLFGVLEGAGVCAVTGATKPDRVEALILYGAFACGLPADDYPWAWTQEDWRTDMALIEEGWGTDRYADHVLRYSTPSLVGDLEFRRWWTAQLRLTMSPGAALALSRMQRDIDLREILRTIQVPALVLHRAGDPVVRVEEGRYVADAIPASTFVELAGTDHPPWAGDQDAIIAEVRRFLGTLRDERAAFDRVLATVLITDIVDSTAQAATVGDAAWTQTRAAHDRIVRAQLARFRGREIKTMGDGFLTTFDGPARGVRCALAIAEMVRSSLGIEIRAGLHTGEVALDGDDVAGLGVVIGARVGALAGPSEVLVSQTVKDLVAGSGLDFDDVGEHELKGVPDRWRLYRVFDAP
jgi:pimeloyl-ACP methyl ester carboxylesterase